jgi:hypothetical protein
MLSRLGIISMVILLAGVLFSGSGCSSQPSGLNTSLGQKFNLKFGQTASITGEPLQITFQDMLGDSRCPTGVTCIWEGEVTCRLGINYQGTSVQQTLVRRGSGPEYATADFNTYQINFGVQPYPQAGKTISKSDYVLNLVIVKKPALTGGILVTFNVVGETYKVFITNKQTIDQVFALEAGTSEAKIPNAKLVRGTDYNAPWSWHTDPQDIQMVDITAELYDGRPSDVENDLNYWLDTVKRFAPWAATIADIQDLRK